MKPADGEEDSPASESPPAADAAPSAEPVHAAGRKPAAAERWSERPAAELERLLEENPSHPDREAISAALAAQWKEHYLRVAREPEAPRPAADGATTPDGGAAPSSGVDWSSWLADRIAALRRWLAAKLAPPDDPPKPTT